MFAKRTVSAILAVVLLIACFSGCKSDNGAGYDYNGNVKLKQLESQVIAENDNLKLTWNKEETGLTLLVKSTGKEWKNFIDDGNASTITSTLDLTYQSQETFQWDSAFSDQIKKVSAEKIKNGIRITYYFDKIKISVPVTYVLRNDSLLMTVNGSQIGEQGEDNRLLSVAPSKAFMMVDKEQDDSYIFISDGIGALIDTKESFAVARRDFSVGSANEASLSTSSDANPYDSCGMRAYGIKDKENAMFCIAEKNAGAVGMKVNAGDVSSDYSKVYADISMVDSDYTRGRSTNAGDVRIVSDRMQSEVSIGLYPLSGDDANYVGMAKCYRKYLEKNGFISNQKRDFTSPYAVTALGGVMVTESVLGVPTKNLKVATTFDEAKELFGSFSKDIGTAPVTRIKGFGETGLNIGKIAGGYKFASEFGNDDAFSNLQKYCDDSGKPLYTDFDIVKYAKSGNGFSYNNDAAKTATLHAAEFSTVNVPLRDYNANNKYRLLSRTKLGNAIDKLVDFKNKKKLSGISLTTFGSIFYSDLTDTDYAVTCRMAKETKGYIDTLKKTGVKLSGSSPAFFSAGLMDTIFDAPLERSGNYNYMVEIPFYQMVYGGVVPMYSGALNTASNPKERLMLAAAGGTGISVSVIKNFQTSYMEDNVEKLYNCNYEYALDLLKTSLDSYQSIYNKTAGKKIVKYEFLNDNMTLTVTEFENGAKVYANHSSTSVESPVGKLEGYGFKMESGD